MDEFFEALVLKEDAKLRIDKQIVSTGLGTRSPNKVYTVKKEYKGIDIIITNEVGTTAIGFAKCDLPSYFNFINFEIDTRSHFSAIFYGRNNRFKIKTPDTEFKTFLKREIRKSEINELVKSTSFLPYVVSKNENNKFSVVTEYHLMYPEWYESISPLIAFYKTLIDRFIQDN